MDKTLVSRLDRAIIMSNLSLVKSLCGPMTASNNRLAALRAPVESPILVAAKYKRKDVLKYLLEVGFDSTEISREDDGSTVLMVAVRQGAEDIFCTYITKYPETVNLVDNRGSAALHIAAKHGRDSMISTMFKWGADKDIRDSEGSTALHIAAAWGNRSTVELLLRQGCAVDALNHHGWSAIDYAFTMSLRSMIVQAAEEDANFPRTPTNDMTPAVTVSAVFHPGIGGKGDGSELQPPDSLQLNADSAVFSPHLWKTSLWPKAKSYFTRSPAAASSARSSLRSRITSPTS